MFLRVIGVGEMAGGFDDDLRADGLPGQGSGIFFLEDFNDLAIDRNAVGPGSNFVGKVAENGIVLQQMGESLRIGEVVDGHEIQVFVCECGAKNVASDASKTINANFYCHCSSKK